ncbi:hypothetical protein MXZ96_18900, partial [Providencia stuartii]
FLCGFKSTARHFNTILIDYYNQCHYCNVFDNKEQIMPSIDMTELLGYSIASSIKMVCTPFEFFYQTNIIGDVSALLTLFFVY